MSINVASMITDVMKSAADTAEKIQKRAKVVDELGAMGIEASWPEGTIRYGCAMQVNKSDLTNIRKVVGRLSMRGKTTAHDFKDTNELEVTLEPSDGTPIQFSYRTKYRKGGKCKVVEQVSPASVYTSLVCEA